MAIDFIRSWVNEPAMQPATDPAWRRCQRCPHRVAAVVFELARGN